MKVNCSNRYRLNRNGFENMSGKVALHRLRDSWKDMQLGGGASGKFYGPLH